MVIVGWSLGAVYWNFYPTIIIISDKLCLSNEDGLARQRVKSARLSKNPTFSTAQLINRSYPYNFKLTSKKLQLNQYNLVQNSVFTIILL